MYVPFGIASCPALKYLTGLILGVDDDDTGGARDGAPGGAPDGAPGGTSSGTSGATADVAAGCGVLLLCCLAYLPPLPVCFLAGGDGGTPGALLGPEDKSFSGGVLNSVRSNINIWVEYLKI